MGIFSRLTPGLVDSASSLMIKSQYKHERKHPRQDSLWQPAEDGHVRGDQSFIRRSAYTTAIVNPLASHAAVGLVGAGIGFAAWKITRS